MKIPMLNKIVGLFDGAVWEPWPCRCEITYDRSYDKSVGRVITTLSFTHEDLEDLAYLVKQMLDATKKIRQKDQS